MSYYPDRYDRRLSSSGKPAPRGRSANGVMVAFLLACVLTGVLFGLLEQFSGEHVFRFLSTLLPTFLGLGIGVALAGKKRWLGGLGCALGGLAVAAGVWLFVPTTAGLSYWSAMQRVHDLQTEPVENLTAYRARQAELKELLRQFPSFRPQAEQAERQWIEKVADATVARAEKLLATDPARASEELRRLAAGLERDREYPRIRERLGAGRRRAVQVQLDAGQRECKGLLDRERFDEARVAAARVATALDSEARVVGLSRELATLGEKVKQAEQDWLKRSVDAAIARADKLRATDPGRASAELRQLAQSLAQRRGYNLVANRLLVARRDAVTARLEAAKKECRDLLKQERYQEAAAAAELLVAGLDAEAAAVGLRKDLAQFSQAYGFLADLAQQAGKPKPE